MRDFEKINLEAAFPPNLLLFGLILPPVFLGMGTAFIEGITPTIPFLQNYLSQFLFYGLILLSIFGIVPKLFKLGWRTICGAIGMLQLSTVAFMHWVPLLSLVFFSRVPHGIGLPFLLLNIGVTWWWCRRFVRFYRFIYQTPELWQCLYEEEDDAVYYMQKGDVALFEKKIKLAQLPPNWAFVLIGAMIIPITILLPVLTRWTGLPFTHIFLSICLPLSLMIAGVTTRGYLIYFYYPWLIKRKTGKNVYIDMGSRPMHLDKLKGRKFTVT